VQKAFPSAHYYREVRVTNRVERCLTRDRKVRCARILENEPLIWPKAWNSGRRTFSETQRTRFGDRDPSESWFMSQNNRCSSDRLIVPACWASWEMQTHVE
jgi:hypothetical protein